MVTLAQLCSYSNNYWTIYFKGANFIAYELHLLEAMEWSMILQEYALGDHEKGQLRHEETEGGAMTSKGFWACDPVESWSAAMQKDPKGWSYTSAGGFVCFRNRVSLCDSN